MDKTTKAVLYSRVSTDRQGKSGLGLGAWGLGLEAQQAAMADWFRPTKLKSLKPLLRWRVVQVPTGLT